LELCKIANHLSDNKNQTHSLFTFKQLSFSMQKRINLILATIIILANGYLLPISCYIIFTQGGPMGFTYLLLPISLPINVLLIPALLSFKKKNRSHPGFLTFNALGLVWILFWLVRIVLT
jgi:hypothetical protein